MWPLLNFPVIFFLFSIVSWLCHTDSVESTKLLSRPVWRPPQDILGLQSEYDDAGRILSSALPPLVLACCVVCRRVGAAFLERDVLPEIPMLIGDLKVLPFLANSRSQLNR